MTFPLPDPAETFVEFRSGALSIALGAELVFNRSNAFTGISVGAAESALKREFETKITNEYRVAISAQNTGSPFSYSKPDAPLSREIVELAHAIDASFAPQVTAVAASGAVPRVGAGRGR